MDEEVTFCDDQLNPIEGERSCFVTYDGGNGELVLLSIVEKLEDLEPPIRYNPPPSS